MRIFFCLLYNTSSGKPGYYLVDSFCFKLIIWLVCVCVFVLGGGGRGRERGREGERGREWERLREFLEANYDLSSVISTLTQKVKGLLQLGLGSRTPNEETWVSLPALMCPLVWCWASQLAFSGSWFLHLWNKGEYNLISNPKVKV